MSMAVICRARDAKVSVEDRGYQFADGVYEVCEVRGGHLIDERRHMARLDRSLGELRIARPMSPAALEIVLRETVRRNRVRDGIVYVQITRGVARRDFPFPPAGHEPSLVVTARSNDLARLEQLAAEGIAVVTVPDIRWQRVDIKSVALLPNVLAKQSARDQGAREAWLVDAQGRVTEGASSNAWIVSREGKLITHPLGHDILPGITRSVVIDVIKAQGLAFEERAFHRRGSLCGARSLCHLGQPDRAAGREHQWPSGRQWRARADRDGPAPRLSPSCRDQLIRRVPTAGPNHASAAAAREVNINYFSGLVGRPNLCLRRTAAAI